MIITISFEKVDRSRRLSLLSIEVVTRPGRPGGKFGDFIVWCHVKQCDTECDLQQRYIEGTGFVYFFPFLAS